MPIYIYIYTASQTGSSHTHSEEKDDSEDSEEEEDSDSEEEDGSEAEDRATTTNPLHSYAQSTPFKVTAEAESSALKKTKKTKKKTKKDSEAKSPPSANAGMTKEEQLHARMRAAVEEERRKLQASRAAK